MIRLLYKVLVSSISLLTLGVIFWLAIFMNPSISYANKTVFDNVTVYHNNDLDANTGKVIKDAITIIQKSSLYTNEIEIDLCMNDDNLYLNLYPLGKNALAFALFNKTVIANCDAKFNENIAQTEWEANNYELRKFDLSYLLAHEFTHNLQITDTPMYWLTSTLGGINWKFEGHADYIARQYQNDGQLRTRIKRFLDEEKKEKIGFPVIELENGTKQIFSYLKYSLVIQYLLEEKNMSLHDIYNDEVKLEPNFQEMLTWAGVE